VAQIVMDHLAHRWSAEEMCRQHPFMTPAEAHSRMAYNYDHREEIDEEIAQEMTDVELDKANAKPCPLLLKLRAKKQSYSCPRHLRSNLEYRLSNEQHNLDRRSFRRS
jgi:hypothetical protein